MNSLNNSVFEDYSDTMLISMMVAQYPHDRNKALTFIYRKFYNYIRTMVIQNSGSDDEAKDVFQEGVIALYENIQHGKFRYKSSIKTYLYKICRNILFQTLLNKNPTIDIDKLYNRGFDFSDESDSQIPSDYQQCITIAMIQLGPDCRRMLTEFYYNKRSMKELKKMFILGSEQAAKNKKMRCLKKLIAILEASSVKQDYFFDENPGVSFFTGKV